MRHLLILVGFSFDLYAQSLPDTIAAEVNGVLISSAQLEKRFLEDRAFVGDKEITKEKVLNDMIDRELGIQRAKKEKLDQDETVKYKMEDVLYHAKISKDLDGEFTKITVSDDDVRSYYRDFPEYRTAHILFRLRSNPSEEEVQAAIEQALKVYKSLEKDPDSFASLASKYSQANNAVNGGDMGFVPAIRFAPEYLRAVKGRQKGAIIPPVRTQFGIHIIKIIAIKPFKEIDMAVYKKIVYDVKRDEMIANYLKKQRIAASVKVNKKILN
jgi:peptidyl-prolyl cis-trans isomerase C